MSKGFSRRDFLKVGAAGAATAVGGTALLGTASSRSGEEPSRPVMAHEGHDENAMGVVGEVDHAANGFDPMDILTDFDYGEVSRLDSGQTLREYDIVAVDKEIEIAPGVYFPAWTYNGRVPGPTLRCVEGDRIRIRFVNAGSHPHTIHFHGIHSASMDGVPGIGAGMGA